MVNSLRPSPTRRWFEVRTNGAWPAAWSRTQGISESGRVGSQMRTSPELSSVNLFAS